MRKSSFALDEFLLLKKLHDNSVFDHKNCWFGTEFNTISTSGSNGKATNYCMLKVIFVRNLKNATTNIVCEEENKFKKVQKRNSVSLSCADKRYWKIAKKKTGISSIDIIVTNSTLIGLKAIRRRKL